MYNRASRYHGRPPFERSNYIAYVVDVCIPTTHIVYGDELTFFIF